MRYFKSIFKNGLTHKQAIKLAKKENLAITRPSEWDGIHLIFKNNDDYIILQKTGTILLNPIDIWNTERKYKDWAVVVPTKRAEEKIRNSLKDKEMN